MDPARWKRVEEIYQTASEREPEERAAFLAVACAEDEGLRREVESLLAQPSAAGLLDRPAWVPEAGRKDLPSEAARPAVGQRVAHYEIQAKLGEGGMGAVYRAYDTQLRRLVALKILPPEYASDPERRSRLLREARVASALNHPNIVSIYEVGSDNGLDFIAMELVEGKSLGKIIPADGMPLGKALDYAVQIAGGLAKAHAAGVIHRDLKPGNIMLSRDGLVKLLDFGLARRVELGPEHDSTLTIEGQILGTPSYMSPEQAQGKPLDVRSDLFSFGVVLYEMLRGKRAFAGGSSIEVMNAVLKDDPPDLPASVTPTLNRIVRRCLEKDPGRRFQSAADLEFALDSSSPSLPRATSRAGWRRALPWALFGATALVFAVFAWVHESAMKNAVPAEPVRLQIPLPTKPPLRLTGMLALSPDGQQLAFAATSTDGIPRIWVRALDSLKIRSLPGTESVGGLLFWSPDSRFVAFDSGGKLQKIDISGGPAETVCVLNLGGVGGSWNSGGVIIFGQFGGTLMRVSAAGGVATPLTALDASHGDVAHTAPWFLPDGRHFIYLRDNGTSGAISVGSLDVKPDGQDSRRLVETSCGGVYIPSSDPDFGQLLFLRGATLVAQPFDARHLNLSGDPVRIVEEPVGAYLDSGLFSVSINGTLAYSSPGSVESQLTWFDEQGKVLSTVGKPGVFGEVALSPDGTRALVSRYTLADQLLALWLLDTSRGTSTRFELDASTNNMGAVWAPDGRSIIFGSARAGHMMDIYKKQMSGAADAEVLVKSNEWKTPSSWSPDGRFLLYVSEGGKTSGDLWVLPLEGHQKPVPFLRTEFDERQGRFSPDGRWVAYISNESGRSEVYVRPFSPDALGEGISNAGGKRLISESGGWDPIWRQDGKELYYIDLDGRLMAVKLTTGSVFQVGVPRVLFQAPPLGTGDLGLPRWQPSPDGKRFLFLVPETPHEVPFTVVLNWQAGLKK
ncbi:MAG: protein kinase domain-containing protein [Bryobacteraceae bacterium]